MKTMVRQLAVCGWIIIIILVVAITYSRNDILVEIMSRRKPETVTKTTELEVPNYVYIDLGARNGDTIKWYLKTFPHRKPSIIWTFEANPLNMIQLDMFTEAHKDVNIHVLRKAAWIHSDGVEFAVDTRLNILDAGSIFTNNPRLKDAMKIKIPSVDFSMWLTNNTKPTDDIILKMDIEGAEYGILEKMIADRTIERISKLIIEFHDRFFPGKSKDVLLKQLKDFNVHVQLWH